MDGNVYLYETSEEKASVKFIIHARSSSFMTILANFLLRLSQQLCRFGNIAEWLRKTADNAAGPNAKLRIDLPKGEETQINVYYDSIEDSTKSLWKHHYDTVGFFFAGRTNEVKIDGETRDKIYPKLDKSADVEPLIRTNIVQKLFGFGTKDRKDEWIQYALIAGVAVLVLMQIT